MFAVVCAVGIVGQFGGVMAPANSAGLVTFGGGLVPVGGNTIVNPRDNAGNPVQWDPINLRWTLIGGKPPITFSAGPQTISRVKPGTKTKAKSKPNASTAAAKRKRQAKA
jgi:hypothetical protein